MKLLTVNQTAEFLCLAPRTVRNKILTGVFIKGKHYLRQPGIGIRFKEQALIDWLEGTDSVQEPEEKKTEQASEPAERAKIPMSRGYEI